jgi:cytochrome b involved in lipid metabolism
MKIKKAVMITLIATFLVATILFGASVLTRNNSNDATSIVADTAPMPTSNEVVEADLPAIDTTIEQSPNDGADQCGVAGGSCSVSEIAKRNTRSKCWVIYRGSYYDVTSYISSHEGGSAVFNDTTCGKDIQAYLEGDASSAGRQNEHGSGAYSDLERLKLGSVVN